MLRRASRYHRQLASVYTLKASAYSSHSQILAAFPEQGQGRSVLDLGCGNAYLGGLLAARGYRVTGVERAGGFDPALTPSGVRMIEADLEQPFALDEQFDFVLCADILEHLRRPEDLLRVAAGALRKQGRLIASLPNSGHLYFRLTVLAGRFPQDDKGLFDRTHVRFYMWNGWRDLLARGGFGIENVRVSGVPFAVAFPSGGAWVDVLEWMSHASARIWKRLFAYQFIVSCYHQEGGRSS
jgi:SAM-dependent methyltransferase